MLIKQKVIHRIDLQSNPKVLYVFGDNNIRSGFGGQAKEMRGESNAIGIRTKWFPTNNLNAFFSDSEIAIIRSMWDMDFKPLYRHKGVIVMPLQGIGTGRAKLSPLLLKTLNSYIQRLTEP